jgi:L-ascorbate metabolism protein UlaG (beta-lactamase superfamily)
MSDRNQSPTTLAWYGHAALGIHTKDLFLLVDPFFTGNPQTNQKPGDLNPDYILVTHGHGDHIGDTVEIAKRCGAVVISNAEICTWLAVKGVKTHAQHLGGGYAYPFGYLKMTFALHGSAMPDGANGGNPGGFLLTTMEGKKLYMAGDTGLFGDMSLIGEEGIDLAVLPIGDNYTMGPDDALRAVKLLKPARVIPIHYNTFPLIKQDPVAWVQRVQASFHTEVLLLQPGETISLG